LELRDNCAVTPVGAADEIPKPPPAFETGIRETRTVNIEDVLRDFEETEARFASAFICHDEDDSMLRE
jgi:hypothetical protein